ncbi:hypothetical protein [Halobacillus aidingensis]|uniref:Uncharacterized protein n=1 Tax=Halobacillus aidingensis TaxID=240303 RepID=A0A1H0ME36_HALAD|nr:hypothetical protein [Halobacillus aidingensis]SDO78575.1 hypothetical protein SAMN05421677_1085 [Halobacillus aidingensis]
MILTIGVLGATVVGVCAVENRLEKSGRHVEAELVNAANKIIIQVTAYGGILWVFWETFKKFGV